MCCIAPKSNTDLCLNLSQDCDVGVTEMANGGVHLRDGFHFRLGAAMARRLPRVGVGITAKDQEY